MHLHLQTNGISLHAEAVPDVCPPQNRLLGSLPVAELERLAPALRRVYLPSGSVPNEPNEALHCIYFPVDCVVSLVQVLHDGASAGTATVGNEGAVGFALVAGADFLANRWIVQEAGFAYRLPGKRVEHELMRHGGLFHVLLRHTQVLMMQLAQTTVCNRHHSLDQQLCRLLLECLDRLPSGKLTMTQECIACLLGVRREGVCVAAGRLQKQGAIRYKRGQMTVIDRQRLELLTCECYAVVRSETERLLPRCCNPLVAKSDDGGRQADMRVLTHARRGRTAASYAGTKGDPK